MRKKFYRHFLDLFVESVKTFGMSRRQMSRHFRFENMEEVNEITRKGKSVVIMGSHYGNWEWTLSISMYLEVPGFGVYTKINNPFFERQIRKSRSRFGANLLLRADTFRVIQDNEDNGVTAVYGLLSDQSPQLGKARYWTDFLGHRLPVFTGAERLAKRHDMAVFFIDIKRIKRGYYVATLKLMTEHPRTLPDYAITDDFLRRVERQIYRQPEYYLWTHNRFKHEGKEKLS